MAKPRTQRIEDMRRLAENLRSHALEASFEFYAEQMVEAAHDLERHADVLEARKHRLAVRRYSS